MREIVCFNVSGIRKRTSDQFFFFFHTFVFCYFPHNSWPDRSELYICCCWSLLTTFFAAKLSVDARTTIVIDQFICCTFKYSTFYFQLKINSQNFKKMSQVVRMLVGNVKTFVQPRIISTTRCYATARKFSYFIYPFHCKENT